MYSIKGDNVNILFQDALWLMKTSGVEMDSRNGKVKMLPDPVCITYNNPMRRVLFNPKRDANPFFHLMEALWMLSGRRDVAWIQQFNSNIHKYSDDGTVFHGAYGFRWRHHFKMDQLLWIAEDLRKDKDSRRAVLGMWDPFADPAAVALGGKDVPCNTHAYFAIRSGRLDITVCNRSNDLVWGALGANAVQFAFLLEWMAWRIGVPIGRYHQISNNLHIYEQHWPMMDDPAFTFRNAVERGTGVYNDDYLVPPLILADSTISHRLFDIELDRFMTRDLHCLEDFYAVPFLNDVAKPALLAWYYRRGGLGNGLAMLDHMAKCDWQFACLEWIMRRENGELKPQ